MKSVLLLGAVQALFLSLLLVTKKHKSTPDFLLVALLIFTSLPLFLYYFVFDKIANVVSSSETMPSFMYFVNVPFIMSFSPFVFLYVKSILKPTKNFIFKNLSHFIPVIVFIGLVFLLLDFNNLIDYRFNFFQLSNYWVFLFFTPLTLILAFYYVYSSFKMLSKFNKKIKQNYSYTDEIDLGWLKILLIIFSSAWIFLFASAIIISRANGNIFLVYKIVLFSLTFIVFIIAFFGFKQSSIFINNSIINVDKKNNNKPVIVNFNDDVKKLTNFMTNNKPYLENKLSIKDLSEMLDWQPNYLSKIINEQLEQNFFEFVNKYRVDEFKNQLPKHKNYTILSVAFDSGFNSKSSFNRIFKDFTGLTPSEYKNSVELTTNSN
ncbi:MAG: AraC family transcriptional regulator [Bacteroidales bacterium]|nr:AraC family transcriptional regulator [Bacteroidales bacterium]